MATLPRGGERLGEMMWGFAYVEVYAWVGLLKLMHNSKRTRSKVARVLSPLSSENSLPS